MKATVFIIVPCARCIQTGGRQKAHNRCSQHLHFLFTLFQLALPPDALVLNTCLSKDTSVRSDDSDSHSDFEKQFSILDLSDSSSHTSSGPKSWKSNTSSGPKSWKSIMSGGETSQAKKTEWRSQVRAEVI